MSILNFTKSLRAKRYVILLDQWFGVNCSQLWRKEFVHVSIYVLNISQSGTSLNPLKKVLQLSISPWKGICLFSLEFFYAVGALFVSDSLPHECAWLRWNFYERYNLAYSWANFEGMNNGICVLWQVFISILLLNKLQVNTYNQKCMKYSPHLLLINMCITICTTSIPI